MDRIEKLYDENFRTLYWAAYGILHDSEKAQDAIQSVFMKALRQRALFSQLSDAQAQAWLYKTTRNACIDALRKRKAEYLRDEAADPAPYEEALPENMVLRKEQAQLVREMVDLLPEKYRVPIFLYYFAELPQGEIAATLNINESTLRSILRRGRSMLHKSMQEGGFFCE